MKTKSLLLATALLMSTSALAQKNTFKGVVLDDLGEPVIGATVQVKGVKGAGAITDLDGNFVIDADANQTLVITLHWLQGCRDPSFSQHEDYS